MLDHVCFTIVGKKYPMHKIDYMLLDYKQQYLSVLEKWGEKQKRKSEEKKKRPVIPPLRLPTFFMFFFDCIYSLLVSTDDSHFRPLPVKAVQ